MSRCAEVRLKGLGDGELVVSFGVKTASLGWVEAAEETVASWQDDPSHDLDLLTLGRIFAELDGLFSSNPKRFSPLPMMHYSAGIGRWRAFVSLTRFTDLLSIEIYFSVGQNEWKQVRFKCSRESGREFGNRLVRLIEPSINQRADAP